MMQGSYKIIELETHKAFIKFLALRKQRYYDIQSMLREQKLGSPPKKGKVIQGTW
jgi:hypothetical protein